MKETGEHVFSNVIVAVCEWALVGGPALKTEPVLVRREADLEDLIEAVRAKDVDVAMSIDPDDLWRPIMVNTPARARAGHVRTR
jgi:hypothetical protein